jgi:hypothetical protein
VLTDEFVTALKDLEPPDHIDAYLVPSKIIIFGHWLRYAGMWPSYQVRLGHRRRLRFKQIGHGQREDMVAARVGRFEEPYLHYSFSHGMKNWLEKHLRYASDEAAVFLEQRAERGTLIRILTGRSATERRRALKSFASCLPLVLRPLARFLYIYLWRRGFLDRRAGLVYAVMLSVYEGMISVFVYERLMTHNVEKIPRRKSLADNQSAKKDGA